MGNLHFTIYTSAHNTDKMISRKAATRFIVVEILAALLLARFYVFYLDRTVEDGKKTLFDRFSSDTRTSSVREALARKLVEREISIIVVSLLLLATSFYPFAVRPPPSPRVPKEKTFSWALSHPSPSSLKRRTDSPKMSSKKTNYLDNSTMSLLKEAKRNQVNLRKSINDNSWMDKAVL